MNALAVERNRYLRGLGEGESKPCVSTAFLIYYFPSNFRDNLQKRSLLRQNIKSKALHLVTSQQNKSKTWLVRLRDSCSFSGRSSVRNFNAINNHMEGN